MKLNYDGLDRRTLAMHVCIDIHFRDIVGRSRLDPNRLPDSTAGSIEDMGGHESLLANWNDIVAAIADICRIEGKNKAAILS